MADCLFHGYSSGPCRRCEEERERDLEQGTLLAPRRDPSLVWEEANRNSLGPEAYRASKSKESGEPQ